MRTEAKFGEEGVENRLSERLDFVRRQLMKNSDLPRFLGLNGVCNDIQSVLAVAIFAYMSAPDDFGTICRLVSMGGPASTHGALIGALIGATIGSSLMPSEMKDNVQNGVRLEGLAIELLNKTLKEDQPAKIEDKIDGDDEYHE
jgi:ADP-ribosylglycohydrolase